MSRGVRGGIADDPLPSFNGPPSEKADRRTAGADQIVASSINDFLSGGASNDVLTGGVGNDVLLGGTGSDTLTGGPGRDIFAYSGNVFADGIPTPAGKTGINVLNKPDVITDFTFGEDQFAFDRETLGINNFTFQKGQSSQIAGDGNAIVLLDSFPAAGAAARAIANNNNITSHQGVFVYFNSTLGLSRLVYSTDLANGGDISVLANLDNQRGLAGLANLSNFTASDFNLV
jgi:Ca2+-binding RTX toxin-like protein